MRLYSVSNGTVGVMLLSVFVHRVGLRGSVLPPAVVVDADLIYRAGLGRSACSHGVVINISTNVLNINDNSKSLLAYF